MTEIEVTPEMIEAGELELAAATAGDVYPPMDVVTDIYRAMEAERRKGEKELLAHVRKLEAASGEAMDGSRPMDEIERTARVLVDVDGYDAPDSEGTSKGKLWWEAFATDAERLNAMLSKHGLAIVPRDRGDA